MALLRLTGLEADDPSFEVPMIPGTSLTVGRALDADLRVIAASVGRLAVRLTCDADGIRVDDLDSGGGSALIAAGVTIPRPHARLEDGAVLQVGGVSFRVEIGG